MGLSCRKAIALSLQMANKHAKEMLNITSHWEIKITGQLIQKMQCSKCDKGIEKLEPLYAAGEKLMWCRPRGKQFGTFRKH